MTAHEIEFTRGQNQQYVRCFDLVIDVDAQLNYGKTHLTDRHLVGRINRFLDDAYGRTIQNAAAKFVGKILPPPDEHDIFLQRPDLASPNLVMRKEPRDENDVIALFFELAGRRHLKKRRLPPTISLKKEHRMCLSVLREATRALERWRGRLADEAYTMAVCHEMEETDRWAVEDARKNPQFSSGIRQLWQEQGEVGRHEWAFSVWYRATGQPREGELTPRWDFGRVDGRQGPSLGVICTGLSFADQMALSLADDLEVDPKTGSLRHKPTGRRFSALVADRGPEVKRLLELYVEPLIIVGEDTDEEEVLAQLCVHGARSDVFDSQQELLDALTRWIRRLTQTNRGAIVSEATGKVVSRWWRPYSSRSFQSFCRRTVVGLLKDSRRDDATQRRVEDRLAGRSRERPGESVSMIAMRVGISRSTAYRWIREGWIPCQIAGERRTYETTLGLSRTYRRHRYQPDEATARVAGERSEERNSRRALVELLASRRGTGVRAARRLIRRRLDKGQTPTDIASEALGKKEGN